MDIFRKCEDWKDSETVREMGLYPYFRTIASGQDPIVTMNGDAVIMVIKTQAVSALTEDGKRIRNHGRGFMKGEELDREKSLKSISQVENIAVLGIIETVIKQYNTENFSIVFSGTPAYQYHVEPKIRKSLIYMSTMVLMLTFLSS